MNTIIVEKVTNMSKGKIIKVCEICNKEFVMWAYKVASGRGKYCSHSCSAKGTKNRIGHPLDPIHKAKASVNWFKVGHKPKHAGKPRPEMADEKHPLWKGLDASYIAKHAWVYRKLGKASFCAKDNTHINRRYDWANISREYKREVTDWVSLCKSCHKKADMKKEDISIYL